MIETIAYQGWPNCRRLANNAVELIVTTDVGPRIIRFGFIGGENEFGEMREEMGITGGDEWHIFGGHRLWHSPEARPRSYYPDNEPVQAEERDDTLILVQPTEATTGIQKEMEITLAPDGPRVTVLHRLRNMGPWPVELAPWALTVMNTGGLGIIPQPTSADPDRLLPNRWLVLWPYTDMTDPRVHWGNRYLTLRQDPNRESPFKLGINADSGWLAYLRGTHLFVKVFDYQQGATYPDGGCSVEMYTNSRFLEAETLGPLCRLEPGKAVEHVERWLLLDGVVCDGSEADIGRTVQPLIEQRVTSNQ
ncbi:MAG TPA: hypothetical protein EYP04_06720 [Anaerolineae bacterium]|nr:hypothetical protein [Anaerolineae bacterium]HIQ06709.1 hypothetical protein [Anaerolineae bacterium]